MTESEWLTCSDPARLLAHLMGPVMELHALAGQVRRPSKRKLRLYVEACRQLTIPEVTAWTYDLDDPSHLQSALEEWTRSGSSKLPLALKADLFRDLFGNPFREVIRYSWDRNIQPRPDSRAIHFRVEWLTWQNGTISRMAQHIYDARDFAALPVLADALSDAGCQEEAILRHCRGQEPCQPCNGLGYVLPRRTFCYACNSTGFLTSPHVRGCWCVDLLLGKV